MQNYHFEEIEIFNLDHNKERAYERAYAMIDKVTNSMKPGIAFHWYSGDAFETFVLIRQILPDKQLILSEACIEYGKYNRNDYLKNAQNYAHDIIGNFNHGMNAFCDWNLLLDKQGGPNYVGNYCYLLFSMSRKRRNWKKEIPWHISGISAILYRKAPKELLFPNIQIHLN